MVLGSPAGRARVPCLARDLLSKLGPWARLLGAGGWAAVLGQLMVISRWRRRRDFAALKALGLLRRQVRAIVAWQVTILTGLALLAGLPLGVAVGRWAWALFSGGFGVPSGAPVPVPFVLLMVPAAILLANAVAFWPGRAVARLSPAQLLRAE